MGFQCPPDSHACQALLNYAVPSVGAVLAIAMFASPIPAVIKACRSSKLAALNPLPYGWQVANSTGWIVYGMFIKNYFVALPNLFGVLLGNLYLFGLVSCCFSTPHTTTTTTTTTTPINNTLSLILLTGVFLPAVVLLEALIAFVSFPNETGQMILGISANVILFVYYMAPISSLADVIKTRNSISISIPLALTSFFNAIFWTIYGLFVNDIFIYLSNAFGVVFAITQLVLVLVFKRRKVEIVEIPPPQRSNTASYDSTNENLNALI